MQKYQDSVLTTLNGTTVPLNGATVTVNVAGGGLATIYATNAGAPLSNPTTTDTNGLFFFYAADGHYDIILSKTGYATITRSDILIEDPATPSSYIINGGSIDGTPIGTTAPSTGAFTTLSATHTTLNSGTDAPAIPFNYYATGLSQSVLLSQDAGSHPGFQHMALGISHEPVGSGTYGPANADFGTVISNKKVNYLTSATQGEIDGLAIVVKQGGPAGNGSTTNSDCAGILIDATGVSGCGWLGAFESATTSVNSSGVALRNMHVQLGVIDDTPTGLAEGMAVTVRLGTINTGIILNTFSTGAYTNYIHFANTGNTNIFNVDGSANITANNGYLRGNLGIGTVHSPIVGAGIGGVMTGGVTTYGVRSSGQILSDVTTQANYFSSLASTQAAAFTLSSLTHFSAAQGTFGAGSTVTTQYGFLATSTLTGATSNYGFYSAITSAAGAWNFVAGGTANNAFAGNTKFGGTSAPVRTVDVTGSISASVSYGFIGNILFSGIAPTIASGFGTTPAIVSSNGTATFNINVGTGGTATSGVITMPAATTGWNVVVRPAGAPQADSRTEAVATSATSVTITNYSVSTGAALAWPTGTVLACTATGY